MCNLFALRTYIYIRVLLIAEKSLTNVASVRKDNCFQISVHKMGVPKFYRWISERYPCLSEVVKENQIPEFDNLYLDMNGIIHPCSHPNDEDVHFRITEEQIFEAIFHYIEVLFRIIKPRKVFFMAVDGVAPRAKMNQQRGRRFRSAREAEERERQALAKGETLPAEKRFDSNCITPGTPFMVRLQEQLKYFVRQKLTKDPMWQGLTVYLSGHETPGEGEHKIMDFIRSEKVRKDYDPNTRHCLYGLDADLIILGLISHEPHFSLLREEVRFGKIANQKRPTAPEETTFHLLHLSLMREYLEIEFSALKPQIDWFDVECIIDDWVLMGYLVGNDFIPHLPDMHISHNALPMLFKAYIEILPSLGGYINEHGTLNLPRFEKYLVHLSKFDREKFEETFSDLSFFAGKTDIRAWKSSRVEAKKEKEKERRAAKANSNQYALLDNFDEVMGLKLASGSEVAGQSPDSSQDADSSDQEDGDTFEEEFKAHKSAYYNSKFEIDNITEFYPYHYAPYMSDLQGISNLDLKYEKGEPFLPFQQLLGVLPAASKDLLPEPYQKLMTMENSPIIDYYPLDFDTDLNGKLQQWEAVVLIPFIDEERLLAAMDSVSMHLTDEERSRNQHGPHLKHTYDKTLNYKYLSSLPGHFPDINACRVRYEELDKDIFHLDPSMLQRGLRPGVKTGVYFPGFPTLHHLKFRTKLSKEEIKVFQQNSRGESIILTIKTENADVTAEDVISEVFGKSCFAEWPHLKEVKVVAVADDTTRFELAESKQRSDQQAEKPSVKKLDMSDGDAAAWVKDIKAIQDRYHKRKGVKIGPSYVLVYACPLMGRRYVSGHSGVVTLEKQWSDTPVAYAYQMMVKDIAVHDSTFQQFKTLEEVFPKQSNCFMLGAPNYGCQGSVVDVEDGRVRVTLSCPVEPDLNHLRNSQSHYEIQYLPAHILAQRLGLTSLIISRLSGSIFVGRGSKHSSSVGASNNFNIGLNLKFNKTNQEIQGYSKKDESGTWLYSTKVIDIIRDYMAKFPEVFLRISKNPRAEAFFEDDLFDGQPGRMKELQDFIKALPCAKVSKVDVGLKNLDEPIIKLIEAEVKKVAGLKVRKQKLCVRPHLLYKPLHYMGNLIPDLQVEHELFDRVINVKEGHTVPLGVRGVIIGIQPGDTVLDCIYEIVFDEEFPGGLVIRCTGNRGYRLPTTAIINISYGMRKEQGQQQSNKPTAVVKPQVFPQPNARTQSRGWYSDIIGRLGASLEQSCQSQRQKQQQRQSHTQVQSKPTAAINYKEALSQKGSVKQETEQSSNSQASLPMKILTRSGPKVTARSPSKEPLPGKSSQSQRIPPSFQKQEGTDSRKNTAKTEKVGQGQRKDAVSKSEVSTTRIRDKALSEEIRKIRSREDKKAAEPEQSPANEVDEFAIMWQNLQKGSNNSGTSSPMTEDSAPDKESSPSDELTSPLASGGQTPLSEEDMTGPSVQMQLALSALPKMEAPGPKVTGGETIVEEGDEEFEGEEFEVDEEARMTPRTYAKSGTEELCRMLNISSVSDGDGTTKDIALPHSVVIEASTGKKQYGIPLTLDQLFAGASLNNPPNSISPAPITPTSQASVPVPGGGSQPTPLHPHPLAQVSGPHPGLMKGPESSHPGTVPTQPRPLPQAPGHATIPVKVGSHGVTFQPAYFPQGAVSPARLTVGNYSPQSGASPVQLLPHHTFQGTPLVTVNPGKPGMQHPASLMVQPVGQTPQQQLGVQQQAQQPIRMQGPGHQSQAGVVKPVPTHADPHSPAYPQQQPTSVSANENTSNARLYPASAPQQQSASVAQGHTPGFHVVTPRPFQTAPVPIAAPGRSHPGPQVMGSPSQPPNLRPRVPFPGQQHGQPPPQGFPARPQNAFEALLMWCHQRGLPQPLCHYQRNNTTGQVRGMVQLANGQQFFGPDCPSDVIAVDAAAHMAMTNLTSQSPRSPMMQQMRPTTRPTLGPMGPPSGPMIHTSGPNPFVPLQVTKQLNSPQRLTSIEAEATSGTTPPRQQMEYPAQAPPSQGAPPSSRVDLAATDQSGIKDNSHQSSRRELDFGSSTVNTVAHSTEVVASVEHRKPSIDETLGAVHSERRASTGGPARHRRVSSKAKLAINFGGKPEQD
ncbi:5'-3' exoribonuclease 1-like [Acanthaster planci]|uniref:5'-3' exoribonuclease 1-like n=1 Tax=Acanthaster planci TaxID=133434 RepID=A0A8B7Z5C3_ACAPL|nr:5'-3' exoribonuclease 1-like [Acanthaster planci]